jgi:hypothetical protein
MNTQSQLKPTRIERKGPLDETKGIFIRMPTPDLIIAHHQNGYNAMVRFWKHFQNRDKATARSKIITVLET